MSSDGSKSDLVSIPDAVDRLALEGPRRPQWLRRYLRRREKRENVVILVDVGGGERPTYSVSMTQLRLHCPELFPAAQRIAQAIKRSEAALRAEYQATTDRLLEVEKKLVELRIDFAALARGGKKTSQKETRPDSFLSVLAQRVGGDVE